LYYNYFVEQYHKPIIVSTTDYTAGTTLSIVVKYEWMGSPHKDYTVKVYSKSSGKITNAQGATVLQHMDGQEPSGFTSSTFRGMNGCPSAVAQEIKKEVKSLIDVFTKGESVDEMITLFKDNWWVVFVWFSFW